MKKRILLIVMSVAFVLSLMCVSAENTEIDAACELLIEVNGEMTEYTTIVLNNTHFVPLRMVFEKLGTRVFFRERDRQILILTGDGDMIQHVVGSDILTVNGEKKSFQNPSVSENYVTYMPTDMLIFALRTNALSFGDSKLTIQKKSPDTDYGRAVRDVLNVSDGANFRPEKFKRYINYHIKKPDSGMNDVVFMVNLGLDIPFYENVSVISKPYELLVLVNKYNRLPWEFKQNNLVSMDRKYTVNDGKQYLLENTAYQKFVQMADAAKKEGVSLRVISAYRTEGFQRNLYNKKTRTLGKQNVDNYSARAGFSEHQTGLAVDINSTKTSFENTAAFKWLQKHAHEYGYILRYPKDKKWITGYAYEPWHYRYVGPDAAKIIYQESSTYEQYYFKYIDVNEFR